MPAPSKSTVEEILALLEVGKGGPVRLGAGTTVTNEKRVLLKDIALDAEATSVTAVISITGWKQESGGRTSKVDREFLLTPDEAARLAKEAGDYRLQFSVAASTMKTQLSKEQARRKEVLDTWCKDGAPTQEDTKVMKPIKFKPPSA